MSETTASRSRRLARELAFQASYMVHIGKATVPEACATVLARKPLTEAAKEYMEGVVAGIEGHKREIDQVLSPLMASGWTLERIAVSDLTVLRLACFELWHLAGIPPKVTITQAVEIAKRFGTADSGAFVNGVLGSVLPQSPKADWDPSNEEVLAEMDGDEDSPVVDAEPAVEEADEEDEAPTGPVNPWQISS